jgi:hypothetical protein
VQELDVAELQKRLESDGLLLFLADGPAAGRPLTR